MHRWPPVALLSKLMMFTQHCIGGAIMSHMSAIMTDCLSSSVGEHQANSFKPQRSRPMEVLDEKDMAAEAVSSAPAGCIAFRIRPALIKRLRISSAAFLAAAVVPKLVFHSGIHSLVLLLRIRLRSVMRSVVLMRPASSPSGAGRGGPPV